MARSDNKNSPGYLYKEHTEDELKAMCIEFIQDGCYSTAKNCIEDLLKIKRKAL